jgi:hypothetical protein
MHGLDDSNRSTVVRILQSMATRKVMTIAAPSEGGLIFLELPHSEIESCDHAISQDAV